ncbi:hypothetical protein [Citromicrobium bathyomarinum]|uniref:hypothetical protein n=1 Tax=Citromicrobium bathyomarinum TaxID=72174 RepID=UPI001E28AFC9|nr:hypothetical protein [Citromicrobium bathyomarinum]MCD1624329.1 hypothetical protein [Citromicrobium bathyomarinum]
MTEPDRSHLAAELERTGIEPHVLAREVGHRTQSELSAGKMRSLLKGTRTQLSEDQWAAMCDFLSSQSNTAKPARKMSDRAPVNEDMRQTLCSELERSKLSITMIERRLAQRFSPLPQATVDRLRDGVLDTIDEELWDDLLALLRASPTRDAGSKAGLRNHRPPESRKTLDGQIPAHLARAGADYVPITQKIWRYLRNEEKRTGIPYNKLFDQLEDIPQGLSKDTVRNWIFGNVKSAERAYLEYIIAHYKYLPNVHSE